MKTQIDYADWIVERLRDPDEATAYLNEHLDLTENDYDPRVIAGAFEYVAAAFGAENGTQNVLQMLHDAGLRLRVERLP